MRRWQTPLALALATGVAWAVGVTLIGTQADSDPVGEHYDLANRGFTLALVLLLVLALVLRREASGRPRLGATLLVSAAGLMLAGNVLEFWGVFFSSAYTEKTALLLGQDSVFWGSPVGWILFLLGQPLLVAAFAVLALTADVGRGRRVGIGLAGVGATLSTVLWAVSPAAAAAAGVVFALALLGPVTSVASAARRQPVPA